MECYKQVAPNGAIKVCNKWDAIDGTLALIGVFTSKFRHGCVFVGEGHQQMLDATEPCAPTEIYTNNTNR
jgi:hypothetical protein